MEEISMCGLFLLEAAKKADKQFQTAPRSSHHTTRSARDDMDKMVKYLLEEKVPQTCETRDTPAFDFTEPVELGMQMIVNGWLKKYLQSSVTVDDDNDVTCTQSSDDAAELDYDINDTLII